MSSRRALHRFALLLASATFILIFVGGLVKSTGSELSVPDWPLAFGKLIPSLKGGVLFEYSHRVVAGVVSILTFGLMLWAILREPRRWVRVLAIAAFALVIAQAILGGITVLFLIPLPIAMAHTATANAFFCVVVALAIFTSPWFIDTEPRKESPVLLPLAQLSAITTGIIYLQILIGALMRHLGAGLAIPDFPTSFGQAVPPLWNEYIAINFIHRCGAVVVTCFVTWTVVRVLRNHRDEPSLRRPALGLIVLLTAQICLGAITVWSRRAVLPTTSHVAIGAAVLVTSLTITIRSWRLFGIRRARPISHRVANSEILDQRQVIA
ncbi:MAG TPA: COX15/CtaA family protein [Candidatus Binataceae bacterium]|nr:COX15/CtaA family protein [Candidatus Binataceae bacterium]